MLLAFSSAILVLLALAEGVVGGPLDVRYTKTQPKRGMPSASSAPNIATTKFWPNGQAAAVTVTGVSVPSSKQNHYLGIPFAAPPVGSLRFVAPQAPTYARTLQATTQPPACLQRPQPAPSATNAGFSNTAFGMSEDCLYLNIYQPSSASADSPTLPVVVWIYGGSFNSGSASAYNAEDLLVRARAKNEDVVFVAFNYRVGLFGWGTGQEFADNNAANLGLRDAIKALEWVQANIGAWGGDPSKVTVAGQSAGAIMASLLYLNPDQDLFRAAIMESGAQSSTPDAPTADLWNDVYAAIVSNASCSTASSSFECLRALDADKLLAAQLAVSALPQFSGGFIFCPSIDGDLIPDSPFRLLEEGKFAKLPFISGNMKDEGTIFIPSTVTEPLVPTALNVLEPIKLNTTLIGQIIDTYPDNANQGSPFDTGDETFGLAPAFKQLAAIVGDSGFQAPRRHFLRTANEYGLTNTWTYQFTAVNPDKPAYFGSYHQLDLRYLFGNATVEMGFTADDEALSQDFMDYFINFAHHLDPNDRGSSTLLSWPAYSSDLHMLSLSSSGNTLIRDDYREGPIEYFLNNAAAFNYR